MVSHSFSKLSSRCRSKEIKHTRTRKGHRETRYTHKPKIMAAVAVAVRNKRKRQLEARDLDSISRAGSEHGSIAGLKPSFDPSSQLKFRQLKVQYYDGSGSIVLMIVHSIKDFISQKLVVWTM